MIEPAVSQHLLNINCIEGIVVVEFVSPSIVEAYTIQLVGYQLEELLGQSSRFVLSFENVRRISSAMIGKLISLAQRINAGYGRLVLCAVRPEIHEVFRILRLEAMFPMYPDVASAFEAISRDPNRAAPIKKR